MTEKEILMNMIKRVSSDVSPERFWMEEENGDFSIFNAACVQTSFQFDEDGNLTWFE